jgi:hypothetical protein
VKTLAPFIVVAALWWLLIAGLAFEYRGHRWFHLLVVWSVVITVAAGFVLFGEVAGNPGGGS